MTIVKVGKHGEIVIKKKFRNSYNIIPGQEVLQYNAGDHIAIAPICLDCLTNLKGKYCWDMDLTEVKKKIKNKVLNEIAETL